MTPGCDYAGCDKPGTEPSSGWDFCADHLLEHLALEAEDEESRPAKRPIDERTEQVVPLVRRGFTDTQIADIIGISRVRVGELRRRAGLRTVVQPLDCGTRWKWQQHRKRGEECEPCRKADAAYHAAKYRMQKRARQARRKEREAA